MCGMDVSGIVSLWAVEAADTGPGGVRGAGYPVNRCLSVF